MATGHVPARHPQEPDLLDPSSTSRLSIDNDQPARARPLQTLERALLHQYFGEQCAIGGTGPFDCDGATSLTHIVRLGVAIIPVAHELLVTIAGYMHTEKDDTIGGSITIDSDSGTSVSIDLADEGHTSGLGGTDIIGVDARRTYEESVDVGTSGNDETIVITINLDNTDTEFRCDSITLQPMPPASPVTV